jgi:hypothetical protein
MQNDVGTPTYHVLPITHAFLLTALSLPPSLSTLLSRNGPFASTGHAYQLCQLANGRVDGAAVAQDKSWPSQATDSVFIRNSSSVAHIVNIKKTRRERTNNIRQPGHGLSSAASRNSGTSPAGHRRRTCHWPASKRTGTKPLHSSSRLFTDSQASMAYLPILYKWLRQINIFT